jgi:hypothetical protein
MSVIFESQPGDELICIISFFVPPKGAVPSWETAREFRVGERVRYTGFRHERGPEYDHPTDWMVDFDAADGQRYSATHTYFATIECWEGLKKYFARQLLKEPRRPRRPSSQKPGV